MGQNGDPKLVGVYGGTFDPVHFGHLRAAVEVKEALSLDELLLIPCGRPAHRREPVANAQQRKRMLELAMGSRPEPGISVDDREVLREGVSYMVDTLQSLHDERPDVRWCLILGYDALIGLDRWSRWQSILELSHIVVMSRPDSGSVSLGAAVGGIVSERRTQRLQDLRVQSSGRVFEIAVTHLAISASGIRERLEAGSSTRYLLPDAVLDYVISEGLYRYES